MGQVSNFLRILFSKDRSADSSSVEELRRTFKARYHQFKLLLNANNKALEIMAEMEEALKGTWPFGMSFVRSRCTGVSTSVFQIVKHLNELDPGQYELLYERFKEIQKRINPSVYPRTAFREGPLVIHLKDVNRDLADQVGSKMANLGEIGNEIRIKVSKGFVITAPAYWRFMHYNDLQSEIDRRIQSTNVERLDQLYELSAALQQLIIGSTLPKDLEETVSEHYHRLERETGKKGTRLAMRSERRCRLSSNWMKCAVMDLSESTSNVVLCPLVTRFREDYISIVHFDQFTYVHKRSLIGNASRLLHVMGNEHNGITRLQLVDQILDPRRSDRV